MNLVKVKKLEYGDVFELLSLGYFKFKNDVIVRVNPELFGSGTIVYVETSQVWYIDEFNDMVYDFYATIN